LLCSLDGQGLDCLGHLLGRWGMRTQRCQDPERLLDYLADYKAPPLLVLMAPWPGSSGHWLDSLRPHLEHGQRVLLLSPPEQHQHLPDGQGLRLLSQPLPLSVTGLRDTLLELYSERRRQLPEQAPASGLHGDLTPCILVAEDNRVNQMVVQGFLKKRGYPVRLVGDGRSAVEEYRRAPNTIRLILMDCEMPELDGF